MGKVFGQHLERAGADPRGPQLRQFAVAVLGCLVGQGPQGYVQAGGAARLGGCRQLRLRWGDLGRDRDRLARLAATALQQPAQRERPGDRGRQERAGAEDGTQLQCAACRG